MLRSQKPFGKRRPPIAEYRSREEEFTEGELSKRSEKTFAIYLTPLCAAAIVIALIFSSESRALALEITSKVIELGKDWVLRGALE
ncbi:hypothetical protein FJ938_12275 [Mesorhizobium sp. B2-4-14]|uniref:hypothetical protein n=1 Tax=Mesorhizobium sp. B2-4-14 TaxID=2589935 RepID=UPI0011293254|nr:hypothetical protein [Mesorhizobium sp. B2-4-14]TPL06792.1 hypothetical protein FJ938_12275 [Mesorhizobium sp. B2-4-14]